jgi:hypothetical protein
VSIRVAGFTLLLTLLGLPWSEVAAGGMPMITGGGNGSRWNCNQCSQIHSSESRDCLRFSTIGEQEDCYRRAADDAGSCWRNCDK